MRLPINDEIWLIKRRLKALENLAEDVKKPPNRPSELVMHRADYRAIREAGFGSPCELLAAWKHKEAKENDVASALEHELSIMGATLGSYKSPAHAITALISWHCGIETDPKVNGGKVLVDIADLRKALGVARIPNTKGMSFDYWESLYGGHAPALKRLAQAVADTQ